MQPIILIGAGRSGTKFLRSLLTASNEVAAIPYDVGYVWRYGNESHSDDELTPENLTTKIKKYIRHTLPKLAQKSNHENARFFVEKSVPNSLRVKYVYELFPDAKFIFLVRDGRAVTESSMRLWKAPTEKGYLFKKLRYFPWQSYRYAIWYILNIFKGAFKGRGQMVWGPRYKGIEKDVENLPLEVVCARQWKYCVELASNDFEDIPKDQVCFVKYEEIMQDESKLEIICDFLGLIDTRSVVDKFKSICDSSNLDKWQQKLKPETLAVIENELSSTLSKFEYK